MALGDAEMKLSGTGEEQMIAYAAHSAALIKSVSIKGILSGGATSEPMEIQQNDHIGPDFGSCIMDVPCNISATTRPIRDFDSVLEPPAP